MHGRVHLLLSQRRPLRYFHPPELDGNKEPAASPPRCEPTGAKRAAAARAGTIVLCPESHGRWSVVLLRLSTPRPSTAFPRVKICRENAHIREAPSP